jgi:hypothetical protein
MGASEIASAAIGLQQRLAHSIIINNNNNSSSSSRCCSCRSQPLR